MGLVEFSAYSTKSGEKKPTGSSLHRDFYDDLMSAYVLELADEVDARLQRLAALLPFGRADFPFMGRYKLGCLDLAYQLIGIPADTVVLDFGNLDEPFRVHKERATVSNALILLVDTEATAQYACRIGEHGILDFLDSLSCSTF